MSESIKGMLLFLVESFRTYSGDNKIWLLYPAALLLIFLLGKREDRKLFVGVLALECLTIYNPFLTQILVNKFGFGNRYLRLFWMLLSFITIAYAMNLVIFWSGKILWRLCVCAVCAALVLGLGNPVFWGADAFPYTPAENSYFTDEEVLGLANVLHSEGVEKPKVLYGHIMLSYCQYDPAVTSVLSRAALMKLEQTSLEDFLKIERYTKAIKNLCRVFYYGDYSISAETFEKIAAKLEIDYVVSSSAELDAYLEKSSMIILGSVGQYTVWKVL